MATSAFGIATVFWALLGDLLFALINAFWTSVLLLLALFAFHRPRLETTLEQSFLGRAYRWLKPAFLYLGPLVGLGYALVGLFWWSRNAYCLLLVNAAWALCFAVAGILTSLRGLRCALSIVCLSAGGLYLVTATWWYAEGRGQTPERGTKFFFYNLLWCIVLIASGLIVDRSRTVLRDDLSS